MDGSLVVYDKEKDDAPFVPEHEESDAGGDGGPGSDLDMQIHKSVHSQNQKTNPVACWKLANQRINAFAFSPDCRHLAVVSEDGTLRVINYLDEEYVPLLPDAQLDVMVHWLCAVFERPADNTRLLDIYYSYYGGLICVCWSPDGKYILTGGQDDLISIWSLDESALVARCQGHQSWVAAVAFDPWRCDDRTYRFGSVGEDGRLCLWDFSVGMLHRPRAVSTPRSFTGDIMPRYGADNTQHSIHHRGSISSRYTGNRPETATTGQSQTLHDNDVSHPVEPRSRIPMLPPVLVSTIYHPLTLWRTIQNPMTDQVTPSEQIDGPDTLQLARLYRGRHHHELQKGPCADVEPAGPPDAQAVRHLVTYHYIPGPWAPAYILERGLFPNSPSCCSGA